ncbi:general substrate transporter [Penicillium angulare]|uniref:General substrate transporter n=1 Tax=Penicillium angulare TaxID=116970 RepID=A0A9W9EF73_9EURO|nr:general substrate transporter [Penicillium angulare]
MGINSERRVGAFNFATVLALCLGSLTYGYSFSVTSTTLGQPSFFSYFNLSNDELSPSYAFTNRIIGGLNGCFSGGGFLGAIFGGWACDALGRKKTLLVCTPIGVLGGALQGGSVNLAMLLAGRLIGGFAVGVLMVLVPLFQSEIAPPATRGFLVSQHGVVVVFGYSAAAWIGYGCYFSTMPAFQWRFPLCLQALWPLVMFILTPFLPESPRWLLMKNRPREAWDVLQKLHDTKNSLDRSSFAKMELYQITKQVAEDQEMSSSETVWTLFTKASYRKRMICAFLVMFGSESTGILVVYNYSVLLYEGLGFTGSIPLLLAAAYVTVAFCGNYISSLLVDRIGRKTSLVIGISGCGVSLIFEAALSATYVGTTNHAGLSAGVFFLFLFISFYGCFVDAATYVYCSEIFPTHIRSRGMSWSLAILFLSTVAYLIPAPTAFAQVGWKYHLLFILLTAIQAPLLWIMLPETKGLALEEIGEKFGDHVAVHITQLASDEKDEVERMFVESIEPQIRNIGTS